VIKTPYGSLRGRKARLATPVQEAAFIAR